MRTQLVIFITRLILWILSSNVSGKTVNKLITSKSATDLYITQVKVSTFIQKKFDAFNKAKHSSTDASSIVINYYFIFKSLSLFGKKFNASVLNFSNLTYFKHIGRSKGCGHIIACSHFLGAEITLLELKSLIDGGVVIDIDRTINNYSTFIQKLIQSRCGTGATILSKNAYSECLNRLRNKEAVAIMIDTPLAARLADAEGFVEVNGSRRVWELKDAVCGGVRLAMLLGKRTNAKVLWLATHESSPGNYQASLIDCTELQKCKYDIEFAEQYFEDKIIQHLQTYGLKQMRWQPAAFAQVTK